MSINFADFFDLRKEWVPPKKPQSESEKRFLQQVEETRRLGKLHHASSKVTTQSTATEYVRAYREKEDMEYRQLRGGDGTSYSSQISAVSAMDNITEAGSVTDFYDNEASMNEVIYGEALDVYNRYDFTYVKPAAQKLVIFQHKDEILSAIEANQVVIIEGFTGCGKTTQVPQYILDYCQQKNRYCNIVVTQPRRVAAISIAERVSDERKWKVGELIGYQVALDKNASEDTRLLYVTTGVILEHLVKRKSFDRYTHIIIDEVHERDKDTDFLMIVVKMLLKTNTKVKIILMSATISADQFAHYFTLPNRQGTYDEPPVISVTKSENSNFPISLYYMDSLAGTSKAKSARLGDPGIMEKISFDNPTIIEEQYRMAAKIVLMFDSLERAAGSQPITPGSAVLIFLPGIYEIQNMEAILEEAWAEQSRRQEISELTKLEILPLHSTITAAEQKRAFRATPGRRKVILSTNIAESSVTVPDIVYVIDFCLSKQLQTDKETNYCSLRLEWASMNALQQRTGRCGRVATGRVYRMIPKYFVEEKLLSVETTPELLRCPLEQSVLRSKELDFGKPERILALALDPPALSQIRSCILSLKEVGAMRLTSNGIFDPDDGDLTVVGRIMGRLPLDIRLSKLIVLGFVFNVLEECIIMAAGLSSKSIFSYPYKARTQAYCSKYDWAQETFSDPLAILHAYMEWETRTIRGEFNRSGSYNREQTYCSERFLQLKQLRDMKIQVLDLKKRLEQFNINSAKPPSDFEWGEHEKQLILKIAIAGACYPYYFLAGNRQNEEIWDEARRDLDGRDPRTAVVFQGFPIDQSRYGELYIPKIRDMLRVTKLLDLEQKGAIEKLDVHFIKGSAKFVVDFRELSKELNTGSESSVNYYVRKAVKMRQLRVPFPLDIKSADEAAILYDQWQKDRERMKNQAASGGSEQIFYTSLLDTLDLPYVTKSEMSFSYAHIENPGCFYLNYQEEKQIEQLSIVYSTLNSRDKKKFVPLRRAPVMGQLVIAPFKGEYFRASVDSVPDRVNESSVFTVVFIDYGNREQKHLKDLYAVDEELVRAGLAKIPALALRCALAEVKPAGLEGRWSRRSAGGQIDPRNETDIVQHFLETTYPLRAQIFSVVDGITRLAIDIEDPEMPRRVVSMKDFLIENNLALPANESRMSRANRFFRENAERASKELIESEEMNQRKSASGYIGLSNDIGFCSNRISLIGPKSPIEAKVSCLAARGTRVVMLDSESVNSVLFEEQPEGPTERLLVSTHVSTTQDGKRLTARNTTVLPAVPGLWAIVALLFAPAIEIRVDQLRSRFTGAICGLGYNPNTEPAESLFPDHDLELAFDVQFSNGDIQNIDKIRYRMNQALTPESGSHGILAFKRHELMKTHAQIAALLFGSDRARTGFRPESALINPSRQSIAVETCLKAGQWNLIPANYVLVTKTPEQEIVFPMHCGVELVKFVNGPRDYYGKMDALKNLVESLESGAIGNNAFKWQTTRCPICDYTANTFGDMNNHIRSREHQQMKVVFDNLCLRL